jgi:hypothetical protein
MIEHAKTNGAPTLLLTARDAANALAISEKPLWTLTAPRGPIPMIRVGERSVRYSVTALQRWIDQQQTVVMAETN